MSEKLYHFPKARTNYIRIIKVQLTQKYFFRLNKSLHLFETHRAF